LRSAYAFRYKIVNAILLIAYVINVATQNVSEGNGMSDGVRSERHDRIGVITLDRPEAMNAWDAAMRRRIADLLNAYDREASVQAVVLTGAGERAFGAGQDLREKRPSGGAEIDAWIDDWATFFGALRGLGKPIIAALNGVAAGSSFQAALMCDLRIGHPGVRMGQPELKNGIPSSMGPWILHACLGPARAAELVMTGRLVPAEEAKSLGLLDRIVPQADVLPEALALAAELGSRPATATRLTKERLRSLTEPGFRGAIISWKAMLCAASHDQASA
jgi:enoyl-CoA hydratase/carnithine racemase